METVIKTETLPRVIEMVKSLTGITMEPRKHQLLSTRLRPRMRDLKISTFEEYLDYVISSTEEIQRFIDQVTTHETHFFRTASVWKEFRSTILDEFNSARGKGTFRVWSAASSTGQEPYSICMLCDEASSKHPGFKYSVFATDVSNEMVLLTRNGEYTEKSVSEVDSEFKELLTRNLTKKGDILRIRDALRCSLQVSQHNLLKPLPRKGCFDAVFLRNVLIYFDQVDKKTVLDNVYQSLAPGGYLILGESESISGIKTQFSYVKPLIYRK